MANLNEILVSVRRTLDDLAANFYDSSEDLTKSIQDGYNLLVALTESIESSAEISFTEGKVFYNFSELIPDYLRIFGIFNNSTLRWLEPVSLSFLTGLRSDWELATGSAYLFSPIDYKYVAIFPAQASGSITVLYKARADILLANSTPQTPEEHTDTLENFCIDDMLDQAQEWGKAINYAQNWEVGVEKIKEVIRKRSSPNQTYYKHSQIGG